MPRFSERRTNTEEQMLEYMQTAIAVYQQLDLPEHLQEIAFTKLMDWAAAKTLIQEQALSIADQWARG